MNAEFAKSLELDYPILSDPGKQVASAYGVVTPERPLAYRWTFYIGTDGRILAIEKKISAGDRRQGRRGEVDRAGRREEAVGSRSTYARWAPAMTVVARRGGYQHVACRTRALGRLSGEAERPGVAALTRAAADGRRRTTVVTLQNEHLQELTDICAQARSDWRPRPVGADPTRSSGTRRPGGPNWAATRTTALAQRFARAVAAIGAAAAPADRSRPRLPLAETHDARLHGEPTADACRSSPRPSRRG